MGFFFVFFFKYYHGIIRKEIYVVHHLPTPRKIAWSEELTYCLLLYLYCLWSPPPVESHVSKNNEHTGQCRGYNDCLGKLEGFVKAEPHKAVAVSYTQEMSFTVVITATQKNACFWIYFKIMDLFSWLMPF